MRADGTGFRLLPAQTSDDGEPAWSPDGRRLVFTGVPSGTMFWLSRMSLDAGYWDFFWPQFIQGWALGLLFIPLTTLTMAAVRREDMGNASSAFNMVRNLGSSIGIAVLSTYMARGVPVFAVVNPDTEAAELVAESGAGWVADSRDLDGACRRLAAVMADDAALARASAAGLGFAAEHFQAAAVAGRFAGLLEGLVRERAGGA